MFKFFLQKKIFLIFFAKKKKFFFFLKKRKEKTKKKLIDENIKNLYISFYFFSFLSFSFNSLFSSFNGSRLSDKTNPQAKGWVSTDRSVVTALPSTTPRQVPKSYTNDSESRHRIWYTHDRPLEARPSYGEIPSTVRDSIRQTGPVRWPAVRPIT